MATAGFTPQGIGETRASLMATAPAPDVRATAQTTQALASEISRKVGGGATRFDIALTPDGMGKVDVQITINVRGEISASMSFDSVQAASELRGRAGELQKALEQAGFTLSNEGLRFNENQGQSFSTPQQQAGQQAWQDAQRRPNRDRAFQDSNELADAAAIKAAEATSAYSRRAAAGIDVRI
jgi:Meckel syndrome type 1 protein